VILGNFRFTARSTFPYVALLFDWLALAKALRARAFVSIGKLFRPRPPTDDFGPYTYEPRGSDARRLALMVIPQE
jgi:hypothetical protein